MLSSAFSQWFDYFEPSFWVGKINAFLDGSGGAGTRAKL